MELKKVNLSQMLETAIVAARLAGQQAMEELQFVRASVKNGTELVTQADAKCQKTIIDRIKEIYPDHGFIAEEGENGQIFKQPPRTAEQIWWIIDPIDGTNNFAHKILLFAVSIAVMCDGEPVVGVIFDPATESMFTAFKGGDAQLNGRKIMVNDKKIDKFASIGLDSHFENGLPQCISELMVQTRFRNLGTTALHLAYVAKGSFAASITCWPKLWDIAAGACIVGSAGGIITNWLGEKIFPVDLDSYDGQSLPVIASNKEVYSEILGRLKS